MTKKDLAEIKKQYHISRCSIQKITGCYVDGEGKKVTKFNNAFLNLPEEEIFKYLEIFKKGLSGTLGKNLFPLEFQTEDEFNDGVQKRLLMLRDSVLADEAIIEEFYDKIISTYKDESNYLILMIFNGYDVPRRASDGALLEDSSEVFAYIQCAICPVKLSEAALSYFVDESSFHERTRDWVVGKPKCGFMFPMFDERETNIHSALYYTKQSASKQDALTQALFNKETIVTSEEKKETFQTLLQTAVDKNDNAFAVVRDIYQNIVNEHQEKVLSGAEEVIELRELKNILTDSGIDETSVKTIVEDIKEKHGADIVPVEELINVKTPEIKIGDVAIKIPAELIDQVSVKNVNGQKCVVFPVMGTVEIDGVMV